MNNKRKAMNEKSGISRRDALKISGLAVGGLALGGLARGRSPVRTIANGRPPDDPIPECFRPSPYPADRYTYFFGDENGVGGLPTFNPRNPPDLEPQEMRISFMGSAIPPYGRAQAYMSIFVEVGRVIDDYLLDKDPPEVKYKAQDQVIFDFGTGCVQNYTAMNINFNRMDKIFLNHLHADHMSDLSTVYCFGPALDRKSPLFVFGPGPSGHRSPRPPRRLYDDGTKAFCRNLREAMRWHTESFSFQPSAYDSYKPPTRQDWGLPCDPIPVGDDPIDDCYAMIPIEFDWRKYGAVPGDNIVYHNRETGVKITTFPVIHCRKGSVGYKIEWTPPGADKPLTMIYTSDTKPEQRCVEQAINGGQGVDVFIHEMGLPPEIWTMKTLGIPVPPDWDPNWADVVQIAKDIQNSSHTTQGAFGYLLSQLEEAGARPRLTVATHFPTTDDNVYCALESVKKHCPWVVFDRDAQGRRTQNGNLVWSYDCMVIRVFPDRIEQLRADVSDYNFAATPPYARYDLLPPKYATADGKPDPTAQLDLSTQIPAEVKDANGNVIQVNYRTDGY